MMSEEEFLEWLDHPGTRAFKAFLEQWRLGLMEQWEDRKFQGSTAHESVVANAEALGELGAINLIRQLDYSEYKETMSEDEPVGTQTFGPGRSLPAV